MKKLLIVIMTLSLLFVFHHVFIELVQGTGVYQKIVKLLHWRYLHQAIFFFGVPLLALTLLKRKPSCYALCWNRHVLISLITIISLTLVLPILVDLIVGQLKPVKTSPSYLLSTLVFQVVFSGCGEELGFRGMYQGELNRVTKKRFKIGSTHFGIGLFISAFFFGLMHLDILNLLHGGNLNYLWFFIATIMGLYLGFIREFVKCIWIVGFIHASYDTYSYLVKPSIAGVITHLLAICVVYYLIFSRKIHAGNKSAEPSGGA